MRSLIVVGWDAQALALGFGVAGVIAVDRDRARRVGAAAEAAGLVRTLAGRRRASRGACCTTSSRNKALLIPSIAFPLFFFTAFAGGLAGISNAPGFDFPDGYTAFQFVFVLLQSAAFAGVFTGFGIARDFETGFARRLLLASSNRSGIVLGYAVAGLIRWLVTAALADGDRAGRADEGERRRRRPRSACTRSASIVNVTATLWAAGVAMRLRTMQAGPIMQMPVFLVLFFAPVYVPLSLLDGWIHARRRRESPDARDRVRAAASSRASRTEVAQAFLLHARARRALPRLGDPRPAQGRSRRLVGALRGRLLLGRRRFGRLGGGRATEPRRPRAGVDATAPSRAGSSPRLTATISAGDFHEPSQSLA